LLPNLSYQRKWYKEPVTQNETYLDLTNIPFKDQIKVINEWAQSLSIIVTTIKTLTKENFIDYLAAILQGDTL
jgi:hypothetical protein